MYSNTQDNSIHRTDYEDLGQVINGTSMGAGTSATSSWFTGVEWVRNIILMASSDQQFDIGIKHQDTTGLQDNIMWVSTANAATGATPKTIKLTGATSSAANLGRAAQFVIKNSSASANTYAKLNVQLMGV